MLIKRIACLVTALLCVGLMAVGCGSIPSDTTPAATTPTQATPAETTPAETTPAATTAPQTAPDDGVSLALPRSECGYYSMQLTGYVLTLTGETERLTVDLSAVQTLAGPFSIQPGHSTFSPRPFRFLDESTSEEERTLARSEFDGLLSVLFGTDPAADTEGPVIAVRETDLNEVVTILNSDEDSEPYFYLVFDTPDREAEELESIETCIGVIRMDDGRLVLTLGDTCVITASADPAQAVAYGNRTYGTGYAVSEGISAYLTWLSD